MKTAFLFGGSGYIGFYSITKFLDLNLFDRYVILDIQEPKYFDTLPDCIDFIKCDVRNPIVDFTGQIDKKKSWIFNFAAIHREPGHEAHEYFDTNINGAKNINSFAEKLGIQNLFFTSSIAPYGKSKEVRSESSMLYPETPYGISKSMAELIHKTWLNNHPERRLIIVRPSVIYGPKDPGNIYRTIKALKKGIFVLPDGGNVIKAYGYVYGLVESMLFTMQKSDREITYNYAEYPLLNLKEMTVVIKQNLGYKRPTLSLPVGLLSLIASVLQIAFRLLGKKTDIHPTRVRKAGFPTNIKPQYLIDNGFEFNFNFSKSLEHWKSKEPKDFA
ncbi:MAG: NAD(P)-dependent oxidoreductase [Bacteroidetes bacterium]|nr:NAD(P)-dependent oxidoreductase [Bacteroidota bacterium]